MSSKYCDTKEVTASVFCVRSGVVDMYERAYQQPAALYIRVQAKLKQSSKAPWLWYVCVFEFFVEKLTLLRTYHVREEGDIY